MKINLPCKITLVRILLIPLVMFFYLTSLFPATKLVALGLFIIACCTDFIDGYVARKYNMVTDLGKFLDPIADKLIATTGILLIICSTVFAYPWGIIVAFVMFARDFEIGLLRQIAATKGVVIAADKLGKFKTIALDIFIPFFMLIDANQTLNFMPQMLLNVCNTLAYLGAMIFVILAVVSGVNYFVKNRKIFA